jgi:antitoxin CptB
LAVARRPGYSTSMSEDIETRRRQALFRAQRRGFRELDLIFGAFAGTHLETLDADQLDRFEALLSVPDWQIYGWITGKEDVPERYDDDIFALLCDYRANLTS